MNSPPASYRPDIDGLRAIAVVSVLLFHFGLPGLQGGFAGVDVFFVISGYLITQQLAAELSGAGGFKSIVLAFYGRRIRRIFPVLAVVLAATLLAGWIALVPTDYVSVGASAAYAAVGAANFYFYWNTGYFDRSAELQPLLHMWSLGVEEQFYLVWPVLLFAMARLTGKRIVWLIGALVLAGLLFSAMAVSGNAKGAFYLPVPRAWELGIGALLAFLPAVRSRPLSNLMGVGGLLLVLVSFATLSKSESSLGLNMLPAVTGAALLVARREVCAVSRMLALRPMRFIGLISYSLYLWHWPILVFYRQTHLEQNPGALAAVGLIALSCALAIISYLLIERPFRRARLLRAGLITVSAIAAVAVAGLAVKAMNGFPARLPALARQLAEGANDYSKRRPQCHRTDAFDPPLSESCVYGNPVKAPSYAVWGDSHGVEIGEAIGNLLNGDGVVGLTYSSCPAAQNFQSPFQKGCQAYTGKALDYLASSEAIKTVIIGTYFELYLRGANAADFRHGFVEAISLLAKTGKRIIIVASNPETGYSIPQAAAKLAMTQSNPAIEVSLANHKAFAAEARDLMTQLQSKYPSIEILDPADRLCSIVCNLIINGRAVLFDMDHLSLYAARLIAEYSFRETTR